MLILLKYPLCSSQPPTSPFSNLCVIERYCTFEGSTCSVTPQKLPMVLPGEELVAACPPSPAYLPLPWLLSAVWICSLRNCCVPIQVQPSQPGWGGPLRMTGAVQGRGWCCKPLQCSYLCVPVQGWPFLKSEVTASQVRVVNSPFTRGKSSPTLVLACFGDRTSLQAARGLSAKG